MTIPTATATAAQVKAALNDGEIDTANRLVTELLGRAINAADIPPEVLEEPETTGDARYDTLIAVGLEYALEARGLAPAAWMTAVPALPTEWLWDGDEVATPEFRALIRQQTPPLFLAKGILLRDRDVRIL